MSDGRTKHTIETAAALSKTFAILIILNLFRRVEAGIPGCQPRQRLHEADRAVQEVAGGKGSRKKIFF